MESLRGIVFDLDDTLISSTAAMRAAIAAILPLLPNTSAPELTTALTHSYQLLWGYGTSGYTALKTLPTETLRTELTTAALAQLGFHDKQLIQNVMHQYAIAEQATLQPLPRVRETLQALEPHFRLGIITNGPSIIQREKLEQVGLAEFFSVFVADADFGAPKPNPALFAYAEQLLGLKNRELLFVGDSPSADIIGANAAGWLGVYFGKGECPEATFCISLMDELLTLPPLHKAKGLAIQTKVADTSE